MAPPLGHGRVTPVATPHRTAGQREDGGERVALATRTTKIRHLGQDLDQRTRMCDHRYRSTKSVLARVGERLASDPPLVKTLYRSAEAACQSLC